jgi:hypothetical protein
MKIPHFIALSIVTTLATGCSGPSYRNAHQGISVTHSHEDSIEDYQTYSVVKLSDHDADSAVKQGLLRKGYRAAAKGENADFIVSIIKKEEAVTESIPPQAVKNFTPHSYGANKYPDSAWSHGEGKHFNNIIHGKTVHTHVTTLSVSVSRDGLQLWSVTTPADTLPEAMAELPNSK